MMIDQRPALKTSSGGIAVGITLLYSDEEITGYKSISYGKFFVRPSRCTSVNYGDYRCVGCDEITKK